MLYRFYENGSRRHLSLIDVQKEYRIKASVSLKRISDTHWSSHTTSLIAIKKCLPFLTNALQKVTCYKSDGEIVAKADGLLNKLKSFNFVLALVMFTDILQCTSIASNILQGDEIDLQFTMDIVEAVTSTLKGLRNAVVDRGLIPGYSLGREN